MRVVVLLLGLTVCHATPFDHRIMGGVQDQIIKQWMDEALAAENGSTGSGVALTGGGEAIIAGVNSEIVKSGLAGTISAPYPEVNDAAPGESGAICMGNQRGVCKPEADCDLTAGYRIQPGMCKGDDYCCTPSNAGNGDDIVPKQFFTQDELCFPLKKNSFSSTNNDWGDGRPRSSNSKRNKRCHAGQDVFSKSPGTVVAIAPGVVKYVSSCFLKCKSGWGVPAEEKAKEDFEGMCAGSVYVWHEDLGITVNYGEIDYSKIKVKKNDDIEKGQELGRAGYCGMLHFEVYEGERDGNAKWWSSQECTDAAKKGKSNYYNCDKPSYADGKNMCAKHAIDQKPAVLLDPRRYLEMLNPTTGKGKWC